MLEANDRGVEGVGNIEGLPLLSRLEKGLGRIVNSPRQPQAGSSAVPRPRTCLGAFELELTHVVITNFILEHFCDT